MKNNKINKKKKKKERTWAEAATMALQMSSTKIFGLREILETIYNKNLKDISLDKAAENVLATMLNHHAQHAADCPFFRVKGKNGLYALKSNWLKKQGDIIPPELLKYEQTESDSLEVTLHSSTDEMLSPDEKSQKHVYFVQGKSLKPGSNKKYMFQNSLYRKKNLLRPSSIHNRRHSSPIKLPFHSRSPLSPRRPPIITRASSLTSRYANTNHHQNHHVQNESNLDLESPGSVLVNANMRALVNKDLFSLLPPSYRFKLTQLLPECDQTEIDVGAGEHKILAPSQTALTNEFFTQAVQEWRERLTDGEFTRETQSRIVQEIAKERSKIEPWKEKFFEEYYGQKKVSNQRLRIRSQNVAAEAGHKMRDLGMEAQLAIFAHLRPELEDGYSEEEDLSESELQISDDDNLPLQNLLSSRESSPSKPVPTALESKPASPLSKPASPAPKTSAPVSTSSSSAPTSSAPTPSPAPCIPSAAPPAPKPKKMSYVEKIAKAKLENSKVQVSKSLPSKPLLPQKAKTSTPVTSLVMRPSWSVGALSGNRLAAPLTAGENILNVQKRNDEKISDHSYTSTMWKKNTSCCSTTHLRTTVSSSAPPLRISTSGALPRSTAPGVPLHSSTTAPARSSTTLVLFPNGHLVQSTIANLQRPNHITKQGEASKKFEDLIARLNSNDVGGDVTKKERPPLVTLKPTLLTSSTNNPDTERVLSLRARPLTPESLAKGGPKSVGVISNVTRQSPSPLSVATLSGEKNAEINSKRPSIKSEAPLSKPLSTSKETPKPVNHVSQSSEALRKAVNSRSSVVTSSLLTPSTVSNLASSLVRPPYTSATTSCTVSRPVQVTSNAAPPPSHLHPPKLSQSLPTLPNPLVPPFPTKATVTTLPLRPPLLISQTKPLVSQRFGPSIFPPYTCLTTNPFHPSMFANVPHLASTFLTQQIMPNSVPLTAHLPQTLNAVRSPTASSVEKVKKEVPEAPSDKSVVEAQKASPAPCAISSSPAQLAGMKRPFSVSPTLTRFTTTSSSCSPSPLKKARTLAEIKAQMKAKRAAAGGRPTPQPPVIVSQQSAVVVSEQPPVVTNTSSHVFSATTFPVYFPPNVNDPNAKVPLSHMTTPPSASYIRLPPTGTLPLEKLQWVSHQGATNSDPSKHADVTLALKPQPPSSESQNSPVKSLSTKPGKSGRGKITLKIKAAGAAISLKVDADFIKKEMTRTVHTPSSDDDMSSDYSHSDDSDRPKMFKHHRGPIKLPKVGEELSDTDSDLDATAPRRWSTSADLDTGQNRKSTSGPSSLVIRPPTVGPSLLSPKSQPVFGVPPFSVSITPGSNIMTPSTSNNYIKESLFQNNPLFTNTTTSNAWSSRKVSPTVSSKETSTTFTRKSARAFRSNSKGKNMENMQKLARDNLFPSDDSAESSFDDDDHVDSPFSTSASEKVSDSDDDVVPTPVHRQAKVECKRHTRSSVRAEENKPNSLKKLTPNNPTMKTT